MMQPYHISVMQEEAIEGLNIRDNGTYVDCTFGGGGHSAAILSKLGSSGRLIAFDQDEDAAANLPNDPRILFIPHNFRHLNRFLKLHEVGKVDGVLADLGVSSHQFDEASRGFSTRFNAPLDMRMDQRQEKTAFQVVQNYPEEELHRIFGEYGEVSNARTLARHIVNVRQSTSLATIESFRESLRGLVRGNPHKYFAQVFQALRIEVNDELTALKELLEQLPEAVAAGGRVVIISFHSLEDRMVKEFFRDGTLEKEPENPFSREERVKPFRLITRKPMQPGTEELKRNPRSRSARMRIAERLGANDHQKLTNSRK